jgi:signal transduction histidine kinase
MQSPSRRVINTGSGVDLAFAVVVLASYFATFSSLKSASNLQIGLMIGLGVGYISIGIYGFKYCVRSGNRFFHLVYFAVQIPLGSIIVYLSHGSGFDALILLPLAGHSVILFSTTWLYTINTLAVAGYVIAVAAYSNSWDPVWSSLPTFLAGVIFVMVFTEMAVSEERARMEVERLAKDLGEANRRLRQYSLQVEELTITRERNRFAREIHDGLGHYLTTIHIQIQAANAVMKLDLERAQRAMEKAQNLTEEALLDVRRSVAALHSSPEESLPLTESIAKILDNCEGADIRPNLVVLGKPRSLSPQAQLTLYRAAQEGVNNTLKHAHATEIKVSLDFTDIEKVRLKVVDNGTGADSMEGGFGLLGLQERALLLDGEFQATSTKGKGFTLEITVPG